MPAPPPDPVPSAIERALARTFNDTQDSGFGTGWMSGTASVFLGFLAGLGAIGFWAPDLFTTAEFRPLYRVAALKALLQVVVGVTFLLAAASLLLRERKVLGLTGLALALAATLIGTPAEVAPTTPDGFTIGLDWFVLNLLLLTLVFIPLERAFHAVFIHANVRFRFGWLDYVITTPRGHHWHHAVEPVDTNFAVHLPLLDRVFGTQHLPGNEWPPEYGISGPPVPEGWWAQQSSPFRRR